MKSLKERSAVAGASRRQRSSASETATLLARLTSLRHLLNEIASHYGQTARRTTLRDSEVIIRAPRDVADLLMPEMAELPYEEFRVVLLTSKNSVIDIPVLYKGTLNSTTIRVAEVFRPAIVACAASIIVSHCHPSGDPTPSPEDVRVTQELVKAGLLLDVECLDHIIIGQGRFVSLKERNLAF